MPGIARVGTDAAGGTLLPGNNSTVFVNSDLVEVKGGPVAGHGLPPHDSPTMAEGSSTVFINGIPLCVAGHAATCGHITSGSNNVLAAR